MTEVTDSTYVDRLYDNAKQVAFLFLGMLPLLFLWSKADYPESFGLHFASGPGGGLERYWYSYLLIERHKSWDVITFIYMWGVAVAFVAWVLWAAWKTDKKADGPDEL